MRSTVQKILKYAASFALAAGLLYLAFKAVNWREFASGIAGTRWGYVLLSMCCAMLAFLFRALRWHMQLGPIEPSIRLRDAFDGVCIGNLTNCALPFAGEFVRCGVTSRGKASYDKTFGTIALERLWDMISIALIILLIVVLKRNTFGAFFLDNVWTPAASRFPGSVWLILAGIAALFIAAGAIVIAFRKRNRLCGKIFSIFEGMIKGFSSFMHMRHKGLFLVYTAAIWTLYSANSICIIAALPNAAGLLGNADALFIMAVGSIASLVPAPGGFGAYHYIVALALTSIYPLAFPEWTAAMVYAVLSHESQAITMILSGLVCWIRYTVKGK